MPHIQPVDPAEATGKTKELLDAVNATLGVTPNLFKTLAASEATLEAYMGMFGALSNGSISAAVGEQIAIAVAQSNSCGYCLSAHSYVAEHLAKLDSGEIERARSYQSEDATTTAILQFAKAVLDGRGASDADVAAAREAGLSDVQLADVVAHVVINVFSNYFNKTFKVDIDFPQIDPNEHAVAA